MKPFVISLLWIVALWRAPSARHEPWKRSLWLALTALATALTFSLPPATRLIDQLSGVTDLATLLKHLTGIVACAAVLDWVIALTRPTPPAPLGRRHALAAVTALTMTVLFFRIDRSAPGEFTPTVAGDPVGTAYLLVFESYLALAMSTATILFLPAARRAPRSLLRWGLWILASGTCLGTIHALTRGLFLLLRLSEPHASDGHQTLYSASQALQLTAILLILTGSSLPAISIALNAAADYRALNALRSLWHPLTASVPQVVLGTPPSRRTDLTTLRDLRVRLLRRTIEIHDARLLLRGYVHEQDLLWARTALSSGGLDGTSLEAATEAAWLHAAINARASGTPTRSPAPTPPRGDDDLAGELRWLRTVATAFQDHAVTAVAADLSVRMTKEHT